MQPLGNDTITFLHYVDDPGAQPDSMGEISQTPAPGVVPQCRHRPLPATAPAQRETPEGETDVGTQVWLSHCPPVPAVLNATLNDEFECNGVTYQIQGNPTPVTGASGTIEFVKMLSKVQEG